MAANDLYQKWIEWKGSKGNTNSLMLSYCIKAEQKKKIGAKPRGIWTSTKTVSPTTITIAKVWTGYYTIFMLNIILVSAN